MENVLSFLPTLLTQVPLMLVMIVGIVLALTSWQRHPRVSALLIIALALQLVSTLFQPIVQGLLIGSGRSVSEIGVLFAINGTFSSLLHAVTLGMILWAALGWRGESTGSESITHHGN